MTTADQDILGSKSAEEKLVQEMRENHRIGTEYWGDTWRNVDLNMRFYTDDQWDQKVKDARGPDRAAISINLCRPKVNQIVNSFRANRPGPEVSPIDNVNNPAMADVHEGLLRHTDYLSNSAEAYDACFKYATASSIGYYGLTYDYSSPTSFAMTVGVRRFPDPKNLIADPSAMHVNLADAKWWLVKTWLSKTSYVDQYGEDDFSNSDFACFGDDTTEWVKEDFVALVEYWKLKTRKRTLVEISDGIALFTDDPRYADALRQNPGKKRSREQDYPYVVQYLMNGEHLLKEIKIPSRRIPIWMVCGDDVYVEGKRKISGAIDDMRTPQMGLNFGESLEMERFAMAQKPKWIGVEGQFEEYEDDFAEANASNKAYLTYKPVSIGGQPAPRPEYVVFQATSPELGNFATRHGEYIKAVSNQYDSASGNIDPRAHSGKAVEALQAASAQGASHISQNFMSSLKIRYQTEIEINQEIMTAGQMVRILGADQKTNVMKLEDAFFDGQYDVAVSTGPSNTSQREAVKDFILQLPESDPQGWALVRDIGVQLMDLGPLGDEIKNRWTPQQYRDQDKQQPLSPEIQQQLAAGQQAQQAVQQLQHIIQTKQVEEQAKDQRAQMVEQSKDQRKALDEQSRDHRAGWLKDKDIQLALIAQKTALLINEQKLNAAQDLEDTRNQLAYIDKVLDQGHEVAVKSADANHQARMAQLQHEHGLESQQQASDLQPDPQTTEAE